MKVNTLGKYKWYLIAIIAAVLIMSIGLSFCIWDTTSIDINGKMNGKTADFKNLPTWTNKLVGQDFVDNKGLRWLVVDKTTTNGKTNMVLMTYYVTEQRVYEPKFTNPDYNSEKNNIRGYLNTDWYPKLDPEIVSLIVPKTIGYKAGTVFVDYLKEVPAVTPVNETTDNYA